MLADEVDYVVGVDTHRDQHVLAVVVASSGGVISQRSVRSNARGYAEAMRFAGERPELVAGIISIAGTLESTCNSTAPIRLLQLRGVKDNTVPYDGIAFSHFAHAPLTSIATSLSTFAKINNCKGNRQTTNTLGVFDAYAGCRAGGGVDFVTLSRIGHVWPTVANSGYDTSAAVWAFMNPTTHK